jgi:2-keto-3-deoxy-L-fuconate dehydrogenase
MTAAEFHGLTALVTGGASGIGLATAQHLAARGARVTILDRDNPRGGAVGQVSALDAVIADVTDDAAVRAAVGAAATTLGGIDILVNNAGVGAIGTVEDNDDEEWRRVFDVNVFGMVRTSRAALPHLRHAA